MHPRTAVERLLPPSYNSTPGGEGGGGGGQTVRELAARTWVHASLASPRLREKRKAWYSAYTWLVSLQPTVQTNQIARLLWRHVLRIPRFPPYMCTEEKLTDGVALATFERQRLVLGIQRLSRNKRKLSPSFWWEGMCSWLCPQAMGRVCVTAVSRAWLIL